MSDKLFLILTAQTAYTQGDTEAVLRFTDGSGQLVTVLAGVRTLANSEIHSADSGAIYAHEMALRGWAEAVVETPGGERASAESGFECSLGEIVAGGAVAAKATCLDALVIEACRALASQLGREHDSCEIDLSTLGGIVAGIVG